MSRLFLAFFILLAGVASVAAQQTLVDRTYDSKTGTRCVVTALTSSLPTSGYVPIRVTLRNGGKIDRTWFFRFTSYDIGRADENNEMRSDFSGECKAGQASSYEFLVPLITTFQQSYSSTAELDLNVSATAYPSVNANMTTFYDQAWPSIMMSASLFKTNASALDSEVTTYLASASSSGSSGVSVRFAGQFSPKQMSDQWQAYSGFDHCLLTEDEWRSLSPGARSALLQWNRFGGSILICSADGALNLGSLNIPMAESGLRMGDRSWGVVRIFPTPTRGILDPNATIKAVTKVIPNRRGPNRLNSLRSDFSSAWPLHDSFGSKTAHILFFILVLIAFGILVGPINLFVFAKAGQRHRLFITTPIISVGASLLLIVLIIFQDGFGGRGERLILMEVRSDNSENTAFICQEQIVRTGVLFGTGFTTNEPAYLTPIVIRDSRWARITQSNDGGSSRYQADVLENGLKVAGDWFQSRSEHGHLAEAIRPTRGRIELTGPAPDPMIVSTFDFTIEALFYLGEDGKIWTANDVQQGRQTTLTELPGPTYTNWLNVELARFTGRNRARLKMTTNRTGHFVAVSSEVDGIDTLESITWKDNHAVITGPVFAP